MSIEATEVERIAKGLTEAQRETLLDGQRCVIYYKPAQKLIAMGIWKGEKDEFTIYPACTPLGLAVRSHLMKGQDHE